MGIYWAESPILHSPGQRPGYIGTQTTALQGQKYINYRAKTIDFCPYRARGHIQTKTQGVALGYVI